MKPPLCICHGPYLEPQPNVHQRLDIKTNQYWVYHPICPIHQHDLAETMRLSQKMAEGAEEKP